MLRRAVKEYDRFLVRRHRASTAPAAGDADATGSGRKPSNGSPEPSGPVAAAAPGYRPTVLEQAVRALLHMLQFAVAYFVML
jgi:copper transporter 1